jgi:hypothetical protein
MLRDHVTFRPDREHKTLLADLSVIAKRDGRSLNNLVQYALSEFVYRSWATTPDQVLPSNMKVRACPTCAAQTKQRHDADSHTWQCTYCYIVESE